MANTSLDIWVANPKAGAFAAVTVDFLVYPMDTLKTRIQSPNYNHLYKDAKTGAIKRNILFRGLYQGVWSVVLATVPSSGAFFTTYETAKHILILSSTHSQPISTSTPSKNPLPITHPLPLPLIHTIASSLGEMVSCAVLTPAEVLKQNAQMLDINKSVSSPLRKGATIQVLAKFRHRPWKLWSGYTALVGRNLPFTGLHFPIFEGVRGWLISVRERGKDSVGKRAVLTGVAAGVSGTVASVVTTPIDVVKTRVMLGASGEGAARKVKGTVAVGKEVLREEGVKGLFRGGALRSLWSAVGMSIYLGMYEGGRMYLEKRRRVKGEDEGRL
ncbi:mitochondrial carrier domain-containing protein [Aspergillus alliaceus]|uniref:Mitochondrial carrier domain-containing protein n=1 Tax=Petromyces alliaceus TaxID=209559 RepID=A0A5N7CLK4_PETAA|nr:mitochondrial carrier domain-containing protein [Aspergillus alliaceus]KAB8238818.1 mitochondrial carrier domain-containing protein [Aspergillus alliaceus]KAE8394353.1 mitochondrial carrier domain-containing protein [Aspergillus alliaceus]